MLGLAQVLAAPPPPAAPAKLADNAGVMLNARGRSLLIATLIAAALTGCAAPAPPTPPAPVTPSATPLPQTPTASSAPPATPWPPTATAPPAAPALDVPVYGYRVVAAYPHDRGAFTQGLVYADGVLYESTGLRGRSSVRRVDLETGEVLQRREVDPPYFAEGLALVGDRLIQLTWQENTAFTYDKDTFEPTDVFSYPTEGWGLAYDGAQLVMSDGTPVLRFRDPDTFEVTRAVTVTFNGQPVERLNELEVVDGQVWANIWQTDVIARIDPATGEVVGWVDLGGLLRPEDRDGVDVLNGIAYDPAGRRLFVTGKLWPTLFEIEVIPPR